MTDISILDVVMMLAAFIFCFVNIYFIFIILYFLMTYVISEKVFQISQRSNIAKIANIVAVIFSAAISLNFSLTVLSEVNQSNDSIKVEVKQTNQSEKEQPKNE